MDRSLDRQLFIDANSTGKSGHDQMDMISEKPYFSRDTDEYTDCFKFGSLDVMIPFERLDNQETL